MLAVIAITSVVTTNGAALLLDKNETPDGSGL